MQIVRCEHLPNHLTVSQEGTSSELVNCTLDESRVAEARDASIRAISYLCRNNKRWQTNDSSVNEDILSRLAAAGANLLDELARHADGGRKEIAAGLTAGDVLSVGSRSMLPWEFIYLSDPEKDVRLSEFLGAQTLIARWYPDARSIGRKTIPTFGNQIEDIPFYHPPEFQIHLAQDDGLRSAVNGKERRIFEQFNVPLTELEPLSLANSESQDRLAEFIETSECLTHFNCHGEAANDPETDGPGRLYVTKRFAADYKFISSIDLMPGSMVILNACFGADLEANRKLCVSAAFARSEADTVLAAYHSLPDGMATTWARELYRQLLNGESIGIAMKGARDKILSEQENPNVLLYTLIGKWGTKLPGTIELSNVA